MNRLSTEERAKILGCLVEGNSIRATCRMTGADKKTALRLLGDVGAGCKAFHDIFGRIHQMLRVTPAMEAGLTDHVWSLEEIAGLAEKAATRELVTA
jgi:hypothetical protein